MIMMTTITIMIIIMIIATTVVITNHNHNNLYYCYLILRVKRRSDRNWISTPTQSHVISHEGAPSLIHYCLYAYRLASGS